MPTYGQQAGPEGLVDLAGQNAMWLSGVGHTGMGASWGDSQLVLQHNDMAWDASPEGALGKAYVGNSEHLGSHLTAAVICEFVLLSLQGTRG